MSTRVPLLEIIPPQFVTSGLGIGFSGATATGTGVTGMGVTGNGLLGRDAAGSEISSGSGSGSGLRRGCIRRC